MIVIPPQDPSERHPDPAEEALGKLYEQFTNVQNLAEFHAALRKREALYELQHQEMSDNSENFESLHPRDFYRQFDRRADDDDKAVVSEAPYWIREQLKDALWAERETARKRALERHKQLFIDRQLAQLDEDRHYYFRKLADAANDLDRERYLTALIGRLKLSGDVGLLYKDDADRLIENIPSDVDIFTFNREFASDPARAQRLLLYGAYPNIRPELRAELVKTATESMTSSTANQAEDQVNSETPGYGSQNSNDLAQPKERDFAQPQDNEEQQTADAPVNEQDTAPPSEGEEAVQHEAVADSESNNDESAASNGLVQVAAAGAPSSASKPGKLWQLAWWPNEGAPSGHKMGLEVDIRLMRNDGKLVGTDWRKTAEYSRALTQDLINAFKSHPNVTKIYFNDPKVTGAQYLYNHDHHLHVVIKP